MTTIEKIRAEIERRIQRENEILWNAKKRGTYPPASCEYNLLTLTSLRDFIDTLSEEPDSEELNDEISRTYHDGSVADTSDLDHISYENIARHFAEWGADHLRDSTKMVDKSLEEAADEWYEKCPAPKSTWWDDGEEMKLTDSKETFIAGAKWRKRQMLKDAVEGVVCILPGTVAYVDERDDNTLKQYIIDNFKAGDKVRIIIVKEEGK